MFGIDEHVAELAAGGGIVALLVVAALLGLRHATDPDHLAAVSALIAGDTADGARRAGRLGLAWGAGHGTTITLFGIPIVMLDAYLPEPVQIGTEMLIGFLIMALSIRLLARWRRGRFHTHDHRHGGRHHTHLHPHKSAIEEMHDHGHAKPLRTMRGSFGVGLLHGVGGSAGIGVLLLAAIPDHAIGITALVLFALFTAVSMGVASSLFGRLLAGRGRGRRRSGFAAPALGVFNLAFGAWYALGAVGAVPYVF
jgi:cytochrome c biogenesis protein CcdA